MILVHILLFIAFTMRVQGDSSEGLGAINKLEKLLTSPFASIVLDTEYTCSPSSGPAKKLNNFHIRGTALGGLLVLEPWLTPSMFYQFLGASERWGDGAKNHVAIDSLTFCRVLGAQEANRQLRAHWKAWVSEEQMRRLSESGVTHLRIPVPDWMYVPYEPFIGCWDGASEELDRVLDLCGKYNIKVLIDLHAIRKSQNGLDNSGDTGHYRWVGNKTHNGAALYEHWTMRGADWVGSFNTVTNSYTTIDITHMLDTLRVISIIVDKFKDHPVVMGVEPVNEPWDHIPMNLLKEFYWRSYQIVQMKAPHWITLLHDSFRLTPENYGNFMRYCDNYALDTHIYQAWAWENPVEWFQEQACQDRTRLMEMEAIGVPIIVGEWSLATDNCAMWINGLNDNVPGYPKVECEMVECPAPYMGRGVIPNTPPDASLPAQDPFGTGGKSYVEYGMCPRDRPFPNEKQVIRALAFNKLHTFDYQTHGQFFWNFRTEFETRWDFLRAVELGWLPVHWEDPAVIYEMAHSCDAFMQNTTILTTAPGTVFESRSGRAFLALPLSVLALCAVWVLVRAVRSKPSQAGYEPVPGEDLL